MSPKLEIPYGSYWSTPFCKWQGAFQHLNSIEFAAWVTRRELQRRSIDASQIDHAILGITVIQHHSFFGLPWLTGLSGLAGVTGQTISQACATGTRLVLSGAQEIAAGIASSVLLVAADRCSNGAHVYYPEPSGLGGTGTHEDWMLDNFSCDPLGNHSMLQTAENVARKHSITSGKQHEVKLRRYEQYQQALKSDREFQRRFMLTPFEVPTRDLKRTETRIEGDQGVFATTTEGLARLKPVQPNGSVTFGGQTHPADGNVGMLLTTEERARAFSRDPAIRIEPVGFGQARAALGYMPEATIPAAAAALKHAELAIADIKVVKTHNPFAINDIVLSQAIGFPLDQMNNYGCSLIWGHPQGPTALRSIIEMIEELVLLGGGYGLFTGCAAGDSAMALVLKVSQR